MNKLLVGALITGAALLYGYHVKKKTEKKYADVTPKSENVEEVEASEQEETQKETTILQAAKNKVKKIKAAAYEKVEIWAIKVCTWVKTHEEAAAVISLIAPAVIELMFGIIGYCQKRNHKPTAEDIQAIQNERQAAINSFVDAMVANGHGALAGVCGRENILLQYDVIDVGQEATA